MAQSVIVLDATVGGAETNTFVDLPEAETLIHQRPFHADWDAIAGSGGDDIKSAALIWATRVLSHFTWVGTIATSTQKQAWPRKYTKDKDGRDYASDAYPEWLEVATTELAFFMATEDRLGDSGTEGFSKIKIDKLEFEVNPNDRSDVVPDYIMEAISPWIDEPFGFSVSRA